MLYPVKSAIPQKRRYLAMGMTASTCKNPEEADTLNNLTKRPKNCTHDDNKATSVSTTEASGQFTPKKLVFKKIGIDVAKSSASIQSIEAETNSMGPLASKPVTPETAKLAAAETLTTQEIDAISTTMSVEKLRTIPPFSTQVKECVEEQATTHRIKNDEDTSQSTTLPIKINLIDSVVEVVAELELTTELAPTFTTTGKLASEISTTHSPTKSKAMDTTILIPIHAPIASALLETMNVKLATKTIAPDVPILKTSTIAKVPTPTPTRVHVTRPTFKSFEPSCSWRAKIIDLSQKSKDPLLPSKFLGYLDAALPSVNTPAANSDLGLIRILIPSMALSFYPALSVEITCEIAEIITRDFYNTTAAPYVTMQNVMLLRRGMDHVEFRMANGDEMEKFVEEGCRLLSIFWEEEDGAEGLRACVHEANCRVQRLGVDRKRKITEGAELAMNGLDDKVSGIVDQFMESYEGVDGDGGGTGWVLAGS